MTVLTFQHLESKPTRSTTSTTWTQISTHSTSQRRSHGTACCTLPCSECIAKLKEYEAPWRILTSSVVARHFSPASFFMSVASDLIFQLIGIGLGGGALVEPFRLIRLKEWYFDNSNFSRMALSVPIVSSVLLALVSSPPQHN